MNKLKILIIGLALSALVALSGCATLKEYGGQIGDGLKGVVDSISFEVSEEGASAEAVGVAASVDFKAVICAVVGFTGVNYCEVESDPYPEAE